MPDIFSFAAKHERIIVTIKYRFWCLLYRENG